MIQSKIVTIISLCTLSLSILCTNPIKAEALTQKNAKEMISGIRSLEGEIRNPDISLSDDELNAKYEGRIYREIEKNYVIKGYPKDELEMVTDKVDSLRRTSPITLSDEEKNLLYRLVYAESGNQSYETQMYVCSVVLNRLRSDSFPDTIKEVIYQPYQFEVVSNGDIETKIPSEMTIRAVDDVLSHGVTNDKVVSFRNDYYHSGLHDEFVSGILYFSSI